MTDAQPMAKKEQASAMLNRNLQGTSFLSLEHLAHMVLVVVVPLLLAMGLAAVFGLWTNADAAGVVGVRAVTFPFDLVGLNAVSQAGPLGAVSIGAALLVLAPLLWVFDKRVTAEWVKRTGYQERVAYKVPVYGALGLLVGFCVALVITMLSVVFNSIAMLGASGAGYGDLYTQQFVPALFGLAVFGGAAWYVGKFAKGREHGTQFSMLLLTVSVILFGLLFITSIAKLHSKSSAPDGSNSGGSSQQSGGRVNTPNYYNQYSSPYSGGNSSSTPGGVVPSDPFASPTQY